MWTALAFTAATLALLLVGWWVFGPAVPPGELDRAKRELEQLMPGICGECSWARYQTSQGRVVDPVKPHRCPEAQQEGREP